MMWGIFHMCHICHLYIYFSKLFRSFANFLIGLFILFLLMMFKRSLYVLNTSPLSGVFLPYCLLGCVFCFHSLNIVSFAEQKFFILITFSISIFFFMDYAFCVTSKSMSNLRPLLLSSRSFISLILHFGLWFILSQFS